MYWLRMRTPGDMRSLLPCSKVTLLHRPRMPNTGAANALPECMGEDYVVPLGALVFQATRRLSDAQSARQTTSSRAKGRATGTWRSVTQDGGYAVLSDGNASAKLEQKSMRYDGKGRSLLDCCIITCVLRSARTHKQGRGQLTQAPECRAASLGVCLAGPQCSTCASQQGDARAEAAREGGREGRVCQAVLLMLTGSQADYYWIAGSSKRRPHLWDRGGFGAYGASGRGSLTREIGRAAMIIMERIDGASRGKEALPCVLRRKLASRRARCSCTLQDVSSRGCRLLPLRVAHGMSWPILHS